MRFLCNKHLLQVGKVFVKMFSTQHLSVYTCLWFIASLQAAQEKGCRDLLPWTGHITNHFWHCAKECEGDAEVMLVC